MRMIIFALLFLPIISIAQNSELDELKALADQGDPAAQLKLGIKYQSGDGVSQDEAEALRLFGLAVEQGHAPAEFFFNSLRGTVRAREAEKEAQERARLAEEEALRQAQERAARIARQEEAQREAQRVEAIEAARLERKKAEIIAQQDARLKSGDFSFSENCMVFPIDLEGLSYSQQRTTVYDKDFIGGLMGAAIRPSGELVATVGRLEDFSDSTLTLRNDEVGFIYLDITDSPTWFNESSTYIGQTLRSVGFYEKNTDATLTTGESVRIPTLRSVCISP